MAGRNPETDHAMRNLGFALIFKIEQIACNNYIYALAYEEVLKFSSIISVLRAHGTKLSFVFFESYNAIAEILNIWKPLTPQLEIGNVDDAAPFRFGHVTPISSILNDSP